MNLTFLETLLTTCKRNINLLLAGLKEYFLGGNIDGNARLVFRFAPRMPESYYGLIMQTLNRAIANMQKPFSVRRYKADCILTVEPASLQQQG